MLDKLSSRDNISRPAEEEYEKQRQNSGVVCCCGCCYGLFVVVVAASNVIVFPRVFPNCFFFSRFFTLLRFFFAFSLTGKEEKKISTNSQNWCSTNQWTNEIIQLQLAINEFDYQSNRMYEIKIMCQLHLISGFSWIWIWIGWDGNKIMIRMDMLYGDYRQEKKSLISKCMYCILFQSSLVPMVLDS